MEVKLHDIGEGMTEADINCFLVKPGDMVKADDPLVEVQTDKMTAEIPSPVSGRVGAFKVTEGQRVRVGTTLLILETADVSTVNQPAISLPEKTSFHQEVFESSNGVLNNCNQIKYKRILASPFTRKIARDHKVDIEKIQGTGPAGRVTDEDVYQFIGQQNEEKPKEELFVTVIKEKQESQPAKEEYIQGTTLPFRGRRKQIARKMHQSVYTIPHCTHFEEVDVTELIHFRGELKKEKENISATVFFMKALSVCLKKYPIFNAVLEEEKERIRLISEHHIGVAVETEDGLIVPVVKDIDKKSLREIHQEMKDLTQKALRDQLTIPDISGGTFTISNVGPLGGSLGATPIILHPQVALVSFHKTKKMPVVMEDDQIAIRSVMNISMSFDHRVADGATAVRFTNLFSEYIKNPKKLLLELI
ncbi:dihydrolipoamide acetyltransferase family protein [Neobacillus terrae]|uniref:dihydrolipoamide acetyltransferase family protein n=1 Tax=Neobacillus terrae TaxID=3034837 RepID=UPI00140E8ECB|nr:dihydrolipoamide acetyltransferase family protein [Neobacillus terrae]NHM31049.1 2-oxo acid dehydrogenase subunit E2 [Neobacillus terrae]